LSAHPALLQKKIKKAEVITLPLSFIFLRVTHFLPVILFSLQSGYLPSTEMRYLHLQGPAMFPLAAPVLAIAYRN
jgi:hypothetical protein